jgi:PAS domain S-box-containing protein
MSLSQIITFGTASGAEAIPLYEGSIGWLAASIGMLAALPLLPTMERVAAARSVDVRQSWMLAGAASMAIGVCAMLYSSMFGVTMPIPARLDISAVALAPLPGILAFAFMIHLVGVQSVTWWRLHLAALLCSCGLSGMHYVVLLSLGLDVTMVIDARTLIVPLVIGYGGTMAGLYAYFGLAGTRSNSLLRRLLGSALITYSTIGNHFSAMGQTQFYTQKPLGTYTALMNPDVLPLIVILVSVIVSVLWIGSMVDARLSSAILSMEESEERSRAIIDGMLDAHITADSNGLIQTINPAAEKLFGYGLAEIRGKPLQMLVGIDYPVENSNETLRPIANQNDAMSSKTGPYDHAGVHKNGTSFPVEVVTSALTTSRGSYFSAIVRDLTAKRAAEAELSLLAAAVENASEAVCITGADATIVYANRAWEQRMSLSRGEMLGKSLYALQKHVADHPDRGKRLVRRSEAGEAWGGPVTTDLPDGRRLTEDLLVTPLRARDGTLTHYVSTWRDISERLAMEQQLLRGQKLEAVGQLAAGIAHEINTPIQYVSDNIRFLKDSFRDISTLLNRLTELSTTANEGMVLSSDIGNSLDAADTAYLLNEIPQALDQSMDGVDRVSKIVRAMKDFSHPATERTQVDINRAIAGTATVASNEWKYVAELKTDFDSELPTVPVMPGDFNQVILNLIVNAAHAIGDVVGDAGNGRGLISLSTRQVDGQAEIRITDTGCGMTPETAARVFDPFFTTKAVGQGTGQGLAMAYNVVVIRHGGTIRVESTPGAGTTFIVRLPLKAPDEDVPTDSASQAA